jgi:hypothetical protein
MPLNAKPDSFPTRLIRHTHGYGKALPDTAISVTDTVNRNNRPAS